MARPIGTTSSSKGFSRREIGRRSQLRVSMNNKLASLTGVPDARMRWSLPEYVREVYVGYGYALVNFPPKYRFRNLSHHTGLARISHLLALWETGHMRFEPVSDEQRRAAAENPLLAAPSPIHDGIPTKPVRPDAGSHRKRPVTDPHNEKGRKKPKSPATVTDEMEAEAETWGRELSDDPISESTGSDDDERREERRVALNRRRQRGVVVVAEPRKRQRQ